jgi:hypothetical protein
MLYQPPLPPNEAPSGDTPLLGCLRSGYALPFVTPAAAHSHPDCRGILILIVAPQAEIYLRGLRQTWRGCPAGFPLGASRSAVGIFLCPTLAVAEPDAEAECRH